MPARKRTSKAKTSAFTVRERILQAVSDSRERNGMPLATLKKALAAGGYDVVKNKASVRVAIRNLLNKGALVQTKGFGASAAFKINKGAAGVRGKRPRGKKVARRGRRRVRRPARKGRKRAGAKKSRKRGKKSRAGKRAAKGRKRAGKGRRRKARKAGKKSARRRSRKAASRRRRRWSQTYAVSHWLATLTHSVLALHPLYNEWTCTYDVCLISLLSVLSPISFPAQMAISRSVPPIPPVPA